VSVAVPPAAVVLERRRAEQIVAVVSAALDNVAVHVGAGAPAWVLVEATGQEVHISVRDAGAGIPAGRLEQAEAEGRLGVSSSIRGRVAELGGVAHLVTGAAGTEWELTFPADHR
jgi:signal transduction histidine kinase